MNIINILPLKRQNDKTVQVDEAAALNELKRVSGDQQTPLRGSNISSSAPL